MVDKDAAQEHDVQPSLRLLSAVEVIGTKGPMTYKDLETALGMSRAATWRVVATLKMAGWVQVRFGGRMIELDPRLDMLLATAHFGDAEFKWFDDGLRDFARELSVHLDLFALARDGTAQLYETSRRLTASAVLPEGHDELLMQAMRAAMTPSQLDRHLNSGASDQAGTENNLTYQLRVRREAEQFQGYVWSRGGRYLVVSLRMKMGSPAALRLSNQSGPVDQDRIMQAFEAIVQRTEGAFESIAKGLRPIA